MNCLAGSEILLGNEGDNVHMADWMLASEALAAAKGALRDIRARQVAKRRQLVNMLHAKSGSEAGQCQQQVSPVSPARQQLKRQHAHRPRIDCCRVM